MAGPLNLSDLPIFEREGELNTVIETPKGSRNKYGFDFERGIFQLKFVLPEGMSFPYDFGFIPSTRAEDGDPLDILVLTDAPLTIGCVLQVRLLGAIKAEQKEGKGKALRNDRLIGTSLVSRLFDGYDTLGDLPKSVTDQIEAFFVSYNEQRGKRFTPLGRCGPRAAAALVKKTAIRPSVTGKG